MTSAPAQVAKRILGAELGEGSSPDRVAEATVAACDRICERLAPVIGDAGVRLLFARSLTLTRPEFPFLADPGADPSEAPWSHLRTRIETQPAALARDASVGVLANFVALLGRLIGNELTAQFLEDLWPEALPDEPPKEPT